MANPKSHRINFGDPFLYSFGLPDDESEVRFPQKNLVVPLDHLSTLPVRYCTLMMNANELSMVAMHSTAVRRTCGRDPPRSLPCRAPSANAE